MSSSAQLLDTIVKPDRVFVRNYALMAAALAAGSAAIPAPIGVLIDVSGLDPIRGVQRQMLSQLSERFDCNLDHVLDSSRLLVGDATQRWHQQWLANGALQFVGVMAGKYHFARVFGRYSKRAIPVASSVVAAAFAFRETRIIGIAGLTHVQSIGHYGKGFRHG